MTGKIYLVEGIFFQRNYDMGKKAEVFNLDTIQSAITKTYTGFVYSVDKNEKLFEGFMTDFWGKSIITDFELYDNGFQFKKQYSGRPIINYSFGKEEEGIWVGEFYGADCGAGLSKCILTAIDKSFFIF